MSDGILYFAGYRKPEVGDFITVYRDDWCIGTIIWSHDKEAPFQWRVVIGQIIASGIEYDLGAAKEEIVSYFTDFCERHGLSIERDSRKPKAEDINWVEYLLAELKHCKTTKDVDGFMSGWKRRLREMVKLERSQVMHEADKLFKELWDKENPEPELEER